MPNISRNIICVCLIACSFQPVKCVEVQNSPAIDEIIVGIKKAEQLLCSDSSAFHIVAVRTKCEEITQSRYSGGYLNTRFAIGRKEGSWYALKQFLKVDSPDNFIILPNRQRVFVPPEPKIVVAKNNQLLVWNQAGRPTIRVKLFNKPGFEGGNIFESIDYFRHLGLNVGRCIAESESVDFGMLCQRESLKDYLDHPFLPDFLEKNKSNYKINPQQEDVDGFPCWVVEYLGMDKFWIDTEHGYVVRKRIYHWEPDKPLKFAIHNSDFREVKPGLWLPYKQIVDKYTSIVSESKDIWDKVASRLHYQLETIEFDSQVPDEIFNVSPPVGTYVVDELRGIEYTIYDENRDPFEDPLKQGIDMLKAKDRMAMWRFIGVVAINICIIIAIWLSLRAKARQDRENKKKDNDKTEK